jgi:hypothetical protein
MKSLSFILAGFFTSLAFVGMIFKAQHWYMGELILVAGIIGFAFISVPIFTYNMYLISKKIG